MPRRGGDSGVGWKGQAGRRGSRLLLRHHPWFPLKPSRQCRLLAGRLEGRWFGGTSRLSVGGPCVLVCILEAPSIVPWWWPCLPTMFHSSAAAPIKKTLKQPHRKPLQTWQNGAGATNLPSNATKCEVAFFINNSKAARCQPLLQLDGTILNTTSLPKFLGVTIDRALSFGPHVVAVVSKASSRCRILASLTSKRWGWRKNQLLKVYRALYLSVINYAAQAWQPWLAPTQLDQLERCQNRALRIITGQLKTTPPDRGGSPEHCNASSLTSWMAYEKAHRLPTNRHRLKWPIWLSTAKTLTSRLPDALSSIDALQILLECPWATRGHGRCFQKSN